MKPSQYWTIAGTIWIAPYEPNAFNLVAGVIAISVAIYCGIKEK